MWSTSRIRQHFLEYFKSNDHSIMPSSSLVPKNDPTLLFTNAGMVQFKNIFTGTEKAAFPRAASSQKCIRAGGKHNDLENVGHTARHHTFFEMLGNFSFGDYFKEKAIYLAWTLITKEFGIKTDKLWITVYRDDEEARNLWKKISGFSDDRILGIEGSDNFWSMGDVGPCGPCSEIFFDHGEKVAGGLPGTAEADGDRYMEFWNLVFMQYEDIKKDDGTIERTLLPKPSIDTGMGLERITAIMQGVSDNFDIDLFRNLIQAIEDESGVSYKGAHRVSHRVIADHLRATCFLIAEGVTPSNEGRGYVLRRIMRRAIRHAFMMGYEKPLLYRLVSPLSHEMGNTYHELNQNQAFIIDTIRAEEERFHQTLDKGLRLLDQVLDKIPSNGMLDGDTAFKLYDTYGFPLDLTQDILRSKNLNVDVAGYEEAMNKQRAEARAAWSGSGEQKTEPLWYVLQESLGSTEFLGYSTESAQGIVTTLLKNLQVVDTLTAGEEGILLFNQTPFYAESGGQMGDSGYIFDDHTYVDVLDTFKRADGLFCHKVRVMKGAVHLHQPLTLTVDGERRRLLRANHSATHLLHAVLRKHLGPQVIQKGSLVAPDRLRFDFSFNAPLTRDQINCVEEEINRLIRLNTSTHTQVMTPEDAAASGAIALFGEKYGETVRVVSMGLKSEETSPAYSIEFCGGTHVHRTGDIGYFKIISEAGIASGVRRIEALTGLAAEQHVNHQQHTLLTVADLVKAPADQIYKKVEAVLEEKKTLEKTVKELREKLIAGTESSHSLKTINGVNFLVKDVGDTPANALKPLVDQLKAHVKSGIILATSQSEDKISLVIGVTADLTPHFSAIDFAKKASEILDGKGGGGRPDLAQAGGTNKKNLYKVIEEIEKRIALGI